MKTSILLKTTIALWGMVAIVASPDATASCWKGFKLGPFKYCQVISPVMAVYWKVSQNRGRTRGALGPIKSKQ